MTKVESAIERKSAQRRRALAGGDRETVPQLDKDMNELYAELRTARARAHNGDRADIVRRARIDREIEKLQTP